MIDFSVTGGLSAIGRQAYYGMAYAAARTRGANPARAETPVEPVAPVKKVPDEIPVKVPVQVEPARIPTAASLNDSGELLKRMQIRFPEGSKFDPEEFWNRNAAGIEGTEGAPSIPGQERCETCAKRKYQDGSDDPGVSFKPPTRISPENAASAVRGHEQEHVVREQAKAEREDRRVVSQYVALHTDICPECGRVYVSGGVTVTVTVADDSSETGNAAAPEEEAAELPDAA